MFNEKHDTIKVIKKQKYKSQTGPEDLLMAEDLSVHSRGVMSSMGSTWGKTTKNTL